MRVVLAEHAGACYGVQRALELAQKAADDVRISAEGAAQSSSLDPVSADTAAAGDASAKASAAGNSSADTAAAGKKGPVFTLGPLIHNPQVVAELERQGIRSVTVPEEAEEGTLIVRSHGVTPDVYYRAQRLGLHLIDATCPHVKRAQMAAAQLARDFSFVVVVGEEGHPEVAGLHAYACEAGGTVVVAGCAADLPEQLPDELGVVVQTTQTHDVLDAVLTELEHRGVHAHARDTICFATQQRQEAALALARTMDAVVVIGGRNSSNTTRLKEICACACPRVFHIETVDELAACDFSDCSCVGVTAGASTPESYIRAVIRALEQL